MLENMSVNLLQLTINVIELFIWFFIISIFLYYKKEYKKEIVFFLLIYLVLFVIERIFPQLEIFNFIISIYSRFIIYKIYKGKFVHKFFAFWISNCVNYVLDMFIISIISIGFDGNLFFSSIQEMNSKVTVTLIKLLLFIAIYIVFKKCVPLSTLKIDSMSNAQTLLLTSLPIFGYVTISVLDYGVRT